MTKTMPAVFIGHGNPMNTLQDNAYTRGWAAIRRLRAVSGTCWLLFPSTPTRAGDAGNDGPLVAYDTLGRDAARRFPFPHLITIYLYFT